VNQQFNEWPAVRPSSPAARITGTETPSPAKFAAFSPYQGSAWVRTSISKLHASASGVELDVDVGDAVEVDEPAFLLPLRRILRSPIV